MTTHCLECGARLSRYADAGETRCAPCGGTRYESHLSMIDAVARAQRERTTVCKRGHDLDEHGKIMRRENGRETLSCAACKRDRDREYARERRAREHLLSGSHDAN